jgi:hypothetical protein
MAGTADSIDVELGEAGEDGNYEATLVVPAQQEWRAAKLIMHLLSHRPIEVVRDAESIRIKAEYPGYMGDPYTERRF